MIPKIANSNRFTEDYKRYQQRILAVTDENLQKELTGLLVKMREQVQYLDRSHEQILFTGKVPSDVSDHREGVIRYKKSLDHRLEAWEKAQLIKPALRPNEE